MDYQDQYNFQGFISSYEVSISLTPKQMCFSLLNPFAKLAYRARIPNNYEGKSKQIQQIYTNLQHFYKYLIDYAEDKQRISIDSKGTVRVVLNETVRRVMKNSPIVLIPTLKIPYFEFDNQNNEQQLLQKQRKINEQLKDRLVKVMYQRKECWKELSNIKRMLNLPQILEDKVKEQYSQNSQQLPFQQIVYKPLRRQGQKSHVSEASQVSGNAPSQISNNLSHSYISSGVSLDTPFKYLTQEEIIQNLKVLTQDVGITKAQKSGDDILNQKTKTIKKLTKQFKLLPLPRKLQQHKTQRKEKVIEEEIKDYNYKMFVNEGKNKQMREMEQISNVDEQLE